jgi:predicted transcriptional regulator
MTAICFGMKRAGLTTKAIAARLGVTESAVKTKCRYRAHAKLTGKGGNACKKSRILAAITEDL